MEAFQQGQVRSRRYRNRRLGEFLKELELTEGRSTGIPTVLKVLRENGSPIPRFHTDEDCTLLEVELFIHPAFEIKEPFVLEGNAVASLDGIDLTLDRLLVHLGFDPAETTRSAIAGIQAGTIAEEMKSLDNQAMEALAAVDSTIAGTIAGAMAGAIAENERKILAIAVGPCDRGTLLNHIGLSNQRKNYERYMSPMVSKGWIAMTIPDKPTSPNQKYLTTLKGRLALEWLKRYSK